MRGLLMGAGRFVAAHGAHQPVCNGRFLVAHVGGMNCVPWNFALFTAPVLVYLDAMATEAAAGAPLSVSLPLCLASSVSPDAGKRRAHACVGWFVRLGLADLRAVIGPTTAAILSVVCLALFVATACVSVPSLAAAPPAPHSVSAAAPAAQSDTTRSTPHGAGALAHAGGG